MAKLADAPDLGSGGKPWGFKSLYSPQNFTRDTPTSIVAHYAVGKGRVQPTRESFFVLTE